MEKHRDPKKPLVSLVIPAFNEEKFIGRTLASVLDQDLKDFELIVVDNNSTDRTAEIAKNYGAKVIFEKERKISCARQTGFVAAKAKVIATTDADTIFPKNWLSRIFKEFEKNKKLVAFGGPFYFYSGSFIARWTTIFLSPLLWNIDRVLSGGWTIPGVNLAIRKEAFERIGGFDTRLTVGEDAEISQRLRKVGQVGFSLSHRVLTSGRRFRNGLLSGFIPYFPHYFFKITFKKYVSTPFPAVRDEKSSLAKFLYLPLFVLVILIFIFFGFSRSPISYGKEIAVFKQRVDDLQQRVTKNFIKTSVLKISPAFK